MNVNTVDYTLGIDCYEGSLETDEVLLHDAGVRFFIVRLNDINGGHHIDENFYNQWEQAERFVRLIYYVYNPWRTGAENFLWLNAHMPAGCITVAIDVEVKKVGYSPQDYAREVSSFIHLARVRWKVIIYTGAWFLPYLSSWPRDVEYWWARYPYFLYPLEKIHMEWAELKQKLENVSWSPGGNINTIPGVCRIWQCTADRLILPGCSERPIDINVWKGSYNDICLWIGQNPGEVPPLTKTVEERLTILEREAGLQGWNLAL